MTPACRIRRCFDFILAGFLLAGVTAALLAAAPLPWWWHSPLLLWAPVMVMALPALLLPALGTRPADRRQVLKVKAAALAMAGTVPFLFWWQRQPQSGYLALCGGLSLLGSAWFVFELAGYVQLLGRLRNDRPREKQAWAVRSLLFYLVMLPLFVIHLLFFAGWVFMPGLTVLDLNRYWQNIPGFLQLGLPLAALLPAAGLAALLLTHPETGGRFRTPTPIAPTPTRKDSDG